MSDAEVDSTLIARVVRSDDHAAFAQLVRRHQAAIRSVLRRLTHGDHGLADDLAQECFLRAYRSLARFRGEARFRTWLYRIALNRYLEHRRSAQASADLLSASLPDDDEAVCGDSLAHEPLLATERSLDVARAMEALGQAEREAVIACYYADLSHSEAALALGWPLGTVKTHVRRGRQKLRAALQSWDAAGKEKSYG